MVPMESLPSHEMCHARVDSLCSRLLLGSSKCSQPRARVLVLLPPGFVYLPAVCQQCRCSTWAAQGQIRNVYVLAKTIDSELLWHKCKVFCPRALVMLIKFTCTSQSDHWADLKKRTTHRMFWKKCLLLSLCSPTAFLDLCNQQISKRSIGNLFCVIPKKTWKRKL